jgi:selenocysteine lyase/cysteine desulfurase
VKEVIPARYGSPENVLHLEEIENVACDDERRTEAFGELERGVHAALETYSNVHRGSGHNSMASTRLFEQARDIVLAYLGLKEDKYVVIFCTPRRAEVLKAQLAPGSYQSLSSQDIGLSLGLRAIAVERKALPRGAPFQTGGGTARLVSHDWVIWAGAPDRFEAGTPAIINIIAFARALQLIQYFGHDAFQGAAAEEIPAADILYHDKLEAYSGRALLDELRQTLVGRSIRVRTGEGDRPYINLDNAASTPTFTSIWEAVCRTWRQPRHVSQQEITQEVKAICAGVLGAPLAAYDVIFTSNTTEAINLAAESLHHESEQGLESVVVNTYLEHNSNELPWRTVPGVSPVRLSVDAEGFLDLGELETLLRAYNQEGEHGERRIKLVAVSGASNVLGTFNDLAEIGRIVHRYGARLLVDAAQLVAHRKVEIARCEIDYFAFSAHKVYAPFGAGALLVRKGLLAFSPAELELIQSSGEENAVGIAALGKALVLLQRIGLDVIQDEEQALTARALRGMAQIPGLTIHGIKDPDSPRFGRRGAVIAFELKGALNSRVARELAGRGGIGVRYGCHCAHMLVKRLAHVPPWAEQLQRVMVTLFPKIALPGVVRVSLGIENGAEDVDTLIRVLGEIARGSRAGANKDVQKQMDEFARDAGQRVYTRLQ